MHMQMLISVLYIRRVKSWQYGTDISGHTLQYVHLFCFTNIFQPLPCRLRSTLIKLLWL